jgi:hypothetical protein
MSRGPAFGRERRFAGAVFSRKDLAFSESSVKRVLILSQYKVM